MPRPSIEWGDFRSIDGGCDGGGSGRVASFAADAVLVTAPLGVLKAGAIVFDPPLSQHKRDAIKRLGFGLLNKVMGAGPAGLVMIGCQAARLSCSCRLYAIDP
jgi:hypothetical protein